MLFYLVAVSQALSQGITLASSDLSDTLWTVSGWSAITSGGTNVSPYNSISSQCNNQNMLILNNNYLTYQKTYTITDYEFYQLIIELDVYFYQFTQTTINIIVNTQNIYTQQFTSSILTLNNICGTGSDSQYTIYQGFYITQQTLQIQIYYIQNIANANSFIGIKNLNIYSNGIPIIGGCPMNTPLLSAGSCVTQCTTTNPYLTGQYWNQCAGGATAASGFKYNLLTNANNFQFTSDSSTLVNSNIYTSSIFHNSVFSSLYQRADPYYMANLLNILTGSALQLNFIFYVFGEWNDGSYVSIYLRGSATTIFANDMITISKTNGQYQSSTQSLFYRTNLTQNGIRVVALKTLIGFSGRFYQIAVQMYIKQVLYGGTASYGFGNIVVYRALSDPNILIANTDMYGFPFTCSNGLFAYNGSCITTCPVYSFTSTTNKNCTDYSSSESSIYNSAIPISQNSYGTYIIKLFYQNNFQQSDIDQLFQTKPPTSKNYLNSESFSFIQSKKILGGYNSWGYGTYQATFINLNAHFQIRFFFTLYLIDGWQTGDTFTYQVDGTVIDTFTVNPTIQYQGLSTLDTIHVISGRKVSHGSSTLSISFNCNIAQKESSKASCGIQNLFVLTDQNVNILCPLSNQFFSYTTQNCETCSTIPCQLFPKNGITAKCSLGCITCTSSTVCTTCDTSNGYQLSGNVCNCLSNYIIISSICQKCYYQCTTCSGTTSYCTSCDLTRTLTSNSCSCNPNYYDIQSITACALITSTCHYSCDTCYGLQYNQCVTCPGSSNRTFQSTSNTCPCDSNYSDNGSTNCFSCDFIPNRITLSQGQCLCDTGYNNVLNPAEDTCVANYTPCYYSCDTCYGPLESNCLSCISANYRIFSIYSCICINQYIDINIPNCVLNYTSCNYQCMTCFGAAQTQCLTCPTTRNLSIIIPGTTQSCVCQDGTFSNNVSTCGICDSTCKTCTSAGSGSCSTCESTQYRTLSGTACPCSSGYNDIMIPGNACVANYTPCHYSCLTCYGASDANCLTCSSTYFRTLQSNLCTCNFGYLDLTIEPCKPIYNPCSYKCLTCFGPNESECITCPPTRYLTIGSYGWIQNCYCQDGTYDNLQPTCLACDVTCQTCTGAGSSGCSSCDSTQNRTLQGTACLCSPGYNDKLNPSNICVVNLTSCHYSCLTCFGIANNQCLTCSSSYFRTINTNICECDINYRDAGQAICVLCHSSCLTCNGTSPSQCLTCNSALNRTLNGSTCPCTNGYNFLANPGQCTINYSPCHYTCATCYGASANQCVSCGILSTYHRVYQTDYTCPCDNNYIDLNSQQTCVQLYSPCHFSCNQCIGPTLYDCANCSPTSNRTFNTGQCQCNSGYNDATNQQTCQQNFTPCDIICLTCFGESSTQCLTCQSSLILNGNICQCPNVTDVYINNMCYPLITPCHYSCSTCINNLNTGCYQCSNNRIFQIITAPNKVCNCIDGYFEDPTNSNLCTLCHYSCLTCQTTQQNCLTCSSQKFRNLINNTCPCLLSYNDQLNSQQECIQDLQNCHFRCQTCFGERQDQCLSCPLYSQRNIIYFQCICGTGYFDNNKSQCDECDLKCQQCANQFDYCLECNVNHFRYLSQNKCDCNEGYYNDHSPICQPCDKDCSICNKNQCLKCKSDQRQLINGQCLCYVGYYLLDQNCHQCENSCLTCLGFPKFQCLTCRSNRILLNNQCVCLHGFFSYKNDCLSCLLGEGKQYKECQYQNYYDGVWTPGENCDDGNIIPRDGCTELNIDKGYQCDNKPMTPSICYQCPDNCQQCQQYNNKIQCTNCIQNYFENQNYCYKCYDENCLKCFNYSYCVRCLYNIQPLNGKCKMCDQGYKQQGNQCQTICGDGILTKEEQCDDNNQYNNDGCSSQCKIEQGYICNPLCRLEQNDIKAQLIKSGNQTNNIQIEILNYLFDLAQLEIKIDLLSINQDFLFNITTINQNKFEIIFQFNKPIKSFNIIHVYLPIKQNQRFLEYIVREIQVIPQEADYYDSTQLNQRSNIKQTQQQFYSSLLYIGPIAFLLGGTSFFIQILDILSWINNFYYINVNYPGNVQIFFQQSNWGLILSLPQIFQFEIQDSNSQLPQKFQDKGVDSLIMNNIQQTLLILIITICCIPLSKYLQILIQKHLSKQQRKRINIKLENNLMLVSSQMNMVQNHLQQSPKWNHFFWALQNQLQDFYFNRYAILLKTINLNILDIILAIMINLKYQDYFNGTIQLICFIFCLIMAILCMIYFYFLYFIAYLHKTLFRWKILKNLSNQLFEGIKTDRISRFYAFYTIFQKSFFIIFIVIYFERPLQQTLSCCSILSGLIILATYQFPFKNKKHLLAQFIPDLILTLILLLSTILAADEQFNRLSFQGRYNVGWIILGLIGISIFIQVIFILKEAFQQFLIKIKWIKSNFS